jgi:hypothetical protein
MTTPTDTRFATFALVASLGLLVAVMTLASLLS